MKADVVVLVQFQELQFGITALSELWLKLKLPLSSGFYLFLELCLHFCLWELRNNSFILCKFPQASLLAFSIDCFSYKQEFFALAAYEDWPVAISVVFFNDYFLLLNFCVSYT